MEDSKEILGCKLTIDEFFGIAENSPISLIYCDLNFTIRYINAASRENLLKIEKLLPVRVNAIVGASIDIFHKVPAHQRRILSNDKNLPHKAIITLEPEKLELQVNAIYDKKNNYVGVMLAWDIVTQKIEMEWKIARINSMIENVPNNVLFCDIENFNIVYANKTSLKTLECLEKYIPIRASELIGTNIDVFHKNPLFFLIVE